MRTIPLECIGCGGTDFDFDRDHGTYQCKRCDRVYFIDSDDGDTHIHVYVDTDGSKKKADKNKKHKFRRELRYAYCRLNGFQDYEESKKTFLEIIDKRSDNYLSWWGLLKSENYNLDGEMACEMEADPSAYQYSPVYKMVLYLAPDDVRPMLQHQFDYYLDSYTKSVYLRDIQLQRSKIDELRQIFQTLQDMKKDLLGKKQDYLFKCTCVFTGIVTTVVLIGFHYVAALIVMALLIAGDVAVCNNFFGICRVIPTRYDEDLEKIGRKIIDTRQKAMIISLRIKELSEEIKRIEQKYAGYDPDEFDEIDEIDHQLNAS